MLHQRFRFEQLGAMVSKGAKNKFAKSAAKSKAKAKAKASNAVPKPAPAEDVSVVAVVPAAPAAGSLDVSALKQFMSFCSYHAKNTNSKDPDRQKACVTALDLYNAAENDTAKKHQVLASFQNDRTMKWVSSFTASTENIETNTKAVRSGWCSKLGPQFV